MTTILVVIFIPITIYILAKLVMTLPVFGQQPRDKDLLRIQTSPYHIKGKFRTIERITHDMTIKQLPKLIKQNNNKNIQKKPLHDIEVIKTFNSKYEAINADKCAVTWLGHSSIFLEVNGLKIFIDPHLGQSASPIPLTVKRFSKTLPITAEEIDNIDIVLLSHDHYDHLDYKTIKRIKNKVKQWITPLGVGSHLKRWGVPENRIEELDWWDSINHLGIQFSSTPNKHFSGRKTNDRNKTLWTSWVIKSDIYNIFFSSDSGYWHGFKDIGEKFGPFDFCMVECGQYNHLWKENHMFPEESLQAFIDLKGKMMLPIHWGAFSLAPHDWRDPIERLLKSAQERNVKNITTPLIGERIFINEEMPKRLWWRECN